MSVALTVHLDVKRLDRAELRLNGVSDGHDVEEGWSELAPLVIESGESLGKRRSSGEEQRALHFVELQLGGIERHHENGDAAREELLRRGNVTEDVVFGLGAAVGSVTKISIVAVDRTAHEYDALELAETGGVFLDGRAKVGERTNGDKRDFAGIFAD